MHATAPNSRWSALVLAVIVAAAIASGVAGAAHPEKDSAAGFAWTDGPEVYAKVCAFCHEATVGPTILGRGLDPAYITFIVRHGFRAMPPFRAAEIDDESLAKVADYISKKDLDR